MKLYHYITRPNTALKDGILSFAKNPNADLRYYYKRSGQVTHAGIAKWFESCFEGRSRGIRVFSEPIKWTENSLSLKEFVDNADMFSIDIDALYKEGLLEAVYLSPPVMITPDENPKTDIGITAVDEVLEKLSHYTEISQTPVDWTVCDDKMGRRFAFVPYYLLIIKDGVIPPRYIKIEN